MSEIDSDSDGVRDIGSAPSARRRVNSPISEEEKKAFSAARTAARKRQEDSGKVVIGNGEVEDTRSVATGIRLGKFPSIYAGPSGTLSRLVKFEGEDGAKYRIEDLNRDSMRAEMANAAGVLVKQVKEEWVESFPSDKVLAAVLSHTNWGAMPRLRAVVSSPVLRSNGTLLSVPGYDSITGLFLSPHPFIGIPSCPTLDDVKWAKSFLLGSLLKDFPWVDQADLANYLALLWTPLLREVLRGCRVPFGLISAHTASTGKSHLGITIPRSLYGVMPLTMSSAKEEDLKKQITTAFGSSAAVISWDNVEETVGGGTLAQLATSGRWTDRRFFSNSDSYDYENDRLFLFNGNNLKVAGDIASRGVYVRLDAKMERPEKRAVSEFSVGDIERWLGPSGVARVGVMRALLVLLLDWFGRGNGIRSEVAMRNFTDWASVCGGVLAWHGIEGFLSNEDALRSEDVQSQEMSIFLQVLWEQCESAGVRWVSSEQIISWFADKEAGHRALPGMPELPVPDLRKMSARYLGQALGKNNNRFYEGLSLRSQPRTSKSKRKPVMWSVVGIDGKMPGVDAPEGE